MPFASLYPGQGGAGKIPSAMTARRDGWFRCMGPGANDDDEELSREAEALWRNLLEEICHRSNVDGDEAEGPTPSEPRTACGSGGQTR
jgi:hypothetical protein